MRIVASYFEVMAHVTLADIAALGLRCGVVDCCDIAEAVALWPAQGPRCPCHLAASMRVAEALGFTLHSTPLPVRRRELDPPSDFEVRARLLELT